MVPDSVVTSGIIICEGKPVPGVSVFIHKTKHDFFEGDTVSVSFLGKSGHDGTFAVTIPNYNKIIRNCIFHLFVTHPDYSFGAHFLRRNYSSRDLSIRLLKKSSISGVVCNEHGIPIEGAHIIVSNTNNFDTDFRVDIETGIPSAEDTTDINGRFFIDGLPLNTLVSFYIEIQGYARRFVPEIPVGIDDIEVMLTPSGGISGRVIDFRTGEPVPDAKLEVHRQRDTGSQNDRGFGTAKTHADGRFFIDGLAPGSYRMTSYIPVSNFGEVGWIDENIIVEPGKTTENLEIAFQPGETGIVYGQITEKECGEPLDSIYVRAEPDDSLSFNTRTGWTSVEAKADADGRYQLRVPIGNVEVSARYFYGINLRTLTEQVTVTANDTIRDVDFQFTRRIDIQGIIRLPDGSPAAGAAFSRGWTRISLADREGRVTVEGLKPYFAYIFTAILGDRFEGVKTVTPRPGESFEMVLEPVKFSEVSGVAVYDDGSPAAGLPLQLHSGLGMMDIDRDVAAVTGEDGSFTIGRLRTVPEKRYKITGAHRQVTSEDFDPYEEVPPISLVFQKETHRIEGNVVDPDGNPVADARVSPWLKGGGFFEDVTDDDGAFLLEGLYPTEVDVSIRHHRFGRRKFEAVSVDTLHNFELTGE